MSAKPQKDERPRSEEVWLIDPYFTESRANEPLTLVVEPTRERTDEDLAQLLPLMKSHSAGVPLSEAHFPLVFRGDYANTRFSKGFPDFFYADGFFLVAEKFADVLRQFDLGAGGLAPVTIYEGNGKKQVPETIYLLNFGCQKSAFLPEQTKSGFLHDHSTPDRPLWVRRTTPQDDVYAHSTAAFAGPDIWHDPKLSKLFFMSGRLVQALRAAKVTRTMGMYKCRIIDAAVAGKGLGIVTP